MNISKKTQRTVLAVAVAALGMGNALAEGPTVSGFIDFGYVYNMNGLSANTYRAFDGSAQFGPRSPVDARERATVQPCVARHRVEERIRGRVVGLPRRAEDRRDGGSKMMT